MIPFIGPLVSAGFGAAKGAYDSHVAEQARWNQEGREDSSVQRKVADLRAAGLAPQLASGGGEPSSAAVRVDESGGVVQGVEDSERENASKLAQAHALMSQNAEVGKSSAEAAMAKGKYERGEQPAIDSEGNIRRNPNNGSIYTNNDWNDVLDQRLKEANANRGTGIFDANEARAALLKSGLSEQEADNAMAAIEAREMTESEQYFVPWMGKGTLGGAAMDAGKNLVNIAGHAALGH